MDPFTQNTPPEQKEANPSKCLVTLIFLALQRYRMDSHACSISGKTSILIFRSGLQHGSGMGHMAIPDLTLVVPLAWCFVGVHPQNIKIGQSKSRSKATVGFGVWG